MNQKKRSVAIAVYLVALNGTLLAQWTMPGSQVYLDPLLGPTSVTVGTTPVGNATLEVRGDQVPITDPLGIGLCTFRTDVASATTQSWRMMRDVNDIGVLWNENNHVAFHVQSGMPRNVVQDRYSGLFLQNHLGDGLWVMNDGEPTGGRAFPHALQLLDAKGFAALGPDERYVIPSVDVTTPHGPWSRLHLFHHIMGTRPLFAHRSQMRNGFTLTGNSDHAYIGQWYDQGENGIEAEVDDNSNLVIAISENALPEGTTHKWDNISFRLFGDLSAGSGASSNVEGQELLRVQPVRPTANDPIEARVGIGDFVTPGEVPSQALDVRVGKTRIRQLPTDPVSTSTEFVTVNTSTGVLEHRPMATLPDNCEWQMENAGYSGPGYQHDVYTAVSSSNDCPDATDAVGIGTISPLAKLDVLREPQSGDETGLRVITQTDGNYSGPNSIAHGSFSQIANASGQSPTPNHMACRGVAISGSKANYGTFGSAYSSTAYPASNGNYGGWGDAGGPDKCYGLYGYANGTGPTSYGVYGKAGTGATVNRAGYFAGNLEYTGSLIPPSDQLLKQNIEDLGDALATLLQLQPKTFQFKTEEYPQMHLATGTQMGLIAQDVAQVLPNLVHDCMHPEEYDTTGTLVHEAVPHLGVDYVSLIPLLVASVKEQQAMIQQQQDLITDMQHQLVACCAAGGDGRALPANQGAAGTSTALETDLRIIPNPVADRTELRYTVGTEGRVRLTITGPDGRTIRTQDEGLRAVGTYSYGWDTTALAPGTYHCTLFVNDELVVRKAVKVNER